ncbi:DUF3108 domain-containing protein [Maridesulfovibrio sp.]|uniref:DUF3108 domain-containing protein n=1 Tax=Maridesulfovibrio sp. TaxID=2795000 RepID=UPI002A18D142|nr:DUF3108 domain-containing protein [Maridesulfovibrio sp.]
MNKYFYDYTFRSLFAAMLFSVGFTFSISCSAHAESKLPFHPGEKIEYNLYWTVFHAGYAELTTSKGNGTSGPIFNATARTNDFVDVFYKVRNRIESITTPGMDSALYYFKKQREGDYHRDITLQFDWNTFSVTRYGSDGTFRQKLPIYPGEFDPLSILFSFRNQPLEVGYEFVCPITDGKKSVIGRAMVTGRETITVAGKEYDTFVIEPEIKDLGGVFKKSPDATLKMWFTVDELHIPVKVKSEVSVGHFSVELSKYTSGDPESKF